MLNDAEFGDRKRFLLPRTQAFARLGSRAHSLCRKEWRFIGNSSPSSLTSTDSRSPGRLEIEMITLYALAAAFGIGVLWLGTNIRSSSSSNAASSSGSAVCNPASADRDSRC